MMENQLIYSRLFGLWNLQEEEKLTVAVRFDCVCMVTLSHRIWSRLCQKARPRRRRKRGRKCRPTNGRNLLRVAETIAEKIERQISKIIYLNFSFRKLII